MDKKFDIFDSLKKTGKPSVPEGFFASFSDNLSAKIEDESIVVGINKSDKAEVPLGFFDNFSDQLMDKIHEQENIQTKDTAQPKKSSFFRLKTFGIVAAAAACILLAINLIPVDEEESFTSENTAESDIIEEEEAFDEAYLAFLDEDEMIEFLIENEDIELGDEEGFETDSDEYYYDEDELYYLLGADIEDYYLEEL
ncbi:MAG: hypothetical protein ACI857_000644 [Arenicella sp.]|jgi:hypothetical protein